MNRENSKFNFIVFDFKIQLITILDDYDFWKKKLCQIYYFLYQKKTINQILAVAETKEEEKPISFDYFPLHQSLLKNIQEGGYTTPFEIQKETLTHSLEGKDLIAKAETGKN